MPKRSQGKLAVVIPCFNVKTTILEVIKSIGPEVSKIYIIDDACPDGTAAHVKKYARDKRITILFNEKNLGVGGAVLQGYKKAIEDKCEIVVKLDGDAQMDGADIPRLIRPIQEGLADYVKGNRFDTLESLEQMPRVRIFGNAALSFLSKFSSGYWNITDPTNGFTAIHRSVLKDLPLGKVNKGYFFESDMLFRLGVMKAVVQDMPMHSRYGEEKSNLKIRKVLPHFLRRHFVNFHKRVFYTYYLREINIASLELPIGLISLLSGLLYGLDKLIESSEGQVTTSGEVMLGAVPIILGIQLLLAFISYDITNMPKIARQSQVADV
jgi:glycosyltransferase involved in cell wall biosynthesis